VNGLKRSVTCEVLSEEMNLKSEIKVTGALSAAGIRHPFRTQALLGRLTLEQKSGLCSTDFQLSCKAISAFLVRRQS
jgi:hypothetical protein